MRRFLKHAPFAWMFLAVVVFWQFARPVAAADDGYRQANRALADALAKGDKNAVAALLDDNFQWVESDGKMHSKAEVLEDLAPLAADNQGAMDVRTLDMMEDAERVLGMHHNERFAHIWMKRAAGWQAILFLNIPIPAERQENTETPRPPTNPNADCENPCRTLPYKPENAAQQGAMDAWFHLKNDEWHPNPDDWSAHSDENHETISPGGDLPKLQHVAQLAKSRNLYGVNGANPGEPVMTMKMFDVGGNVVLQECWQGRTGATKPTNFVSRVFINRGDGWKIILSAQTIIKANS